MTEFPSWIKLLKSWKSNHGTSSYGGRARWNVYRDTARTRRLVGYLEYGPHEDNLYATDITENILGAFTKEINKAGHLPEKRLLSLLTKEAAALGIPADTMASRLVDSGWLGRWVRLNPDEKTIVSVEYGPMSPLLRLLGEQRQLLLDSNHQWLIDREERLKRILSLLKNFYPAGLANNQDGLGRKNDVVSALKNITEHIRAKSQEIREISPSKKAFFHQDYPWPFSPISTSSKFHLGVDFLLALAECLWEMPEGFEWKEIGARFAPSIGGSKYFDPAKDELIQMAEAICEVPLDRLGLTSLGSLYPLYILGDLQLIRGRTYLVYPPDTICALSNIQVDRVEEVSTRARRIILTENRALLLKMEATGWQLREPMSLTIGIDGRVRLAHGRLLKMLADAEQEKAVFAWVDTDQSGVDIARQINEILPQCLFVSAHLRQTTAALPYQEWLRQIQEKPELRDREQEEFLGNPEIWDLVFKAIHPHP